MASINKESVREEFDKIKQNFQDLVAAGKVTPETKALVDTLFMLVSIIMSIFMEKLTKKNSKNSSIPPSQTPPDESSNNTDSKHGKNKNTAQAGKAENIRTVEYVTVLNVSNCDNYNGWVN